MKPTRNFWTYWVVCKNQEILIIIIINEIYPVSNKKEINVYTCCFSWPLWSGVLVTLGKIWILNKLKKKLAIHNNFATKLNRPCYLTDLYVLNTLPIFNLSFYTIIIYFEGKRFWFIIYEVRLYNLKVIQG